MASTGTKSEAQFKSPLKQLIKRLIHMTIYLGSFDYGLTSAVGFNQFLITFLLEKSQPG